MNERKKNTETNKDIDPTKIMQACVGPLCNGKELTLINFTKNSSCKYGYGYNCKDCRKVLRRQNIKKENQCILKEKYCIGCDKIIDTINFAQDSYTSDGYQSRCKKCNIKKGQISYSKLNVFIKKILSDARARCKKKSKIGRNMEMNITFDDVMKLYNEQQGKCALTNIQMTHNCINDRDEDSKQIMNPHNISMDRIDSTIGYVLSNVRLVCALVNKIKFDMTDIQLSSICLKIIQTSNLKSIDDTMNKLFPKLANKKIDTNIDTKLKNFIFKRLDQTIYNAKSRKIEIEINQYDIIKKYITQKGCCALTGTKLTFDSDDKNNFSDLSIDRIDSKLGYTFENIQLVSGIINKIKSDVDDNEFIRLCEKIYGGMKSYNMKRFNNACTKLNQK